MKRKNAGNDLTRNRETNEPFVQLATRIPKVLHRQMKLYCIQINVSVMDFVTEALRERLVHQKKRAA